MNDIPVTSDNSCVRVGKASEWLSVLCFISTSSILSFRVRAIFHNSLRIRALLLLTWAMVVILAFFLPFSTQFTHVQIASPSAASGCVITGAGFNLTIEQSLAIIYDTLVWLALSIRLLRNSSEETWSRRLWMSLRGGLPHVSRLIFQTEQLSYA